MDDEEWKTIEDSKYEVSSVGNVRNKATNLILKLKKDNYYRATIFNDGKPKLCLVHRLVGKAFIPNPNNKKIIDHIDGNNYNNIVSNLRWVTSQENIWNKNYKGYSKRPSGRFEATIRDNNGKKTYLGIYDTEEEAKSVYDKKALEFRGGFIRAPPDTTYEFLGK